MNSWRPNWQDETLYPSPETTDRSEWAWEFLRRNVDYQNDYMEYALFLDDNNYFDAVKNLNDKSNSAEIRENAANIALRVNQLQNGISDKYGVRCYLSFRIPDPRLSYQELVLSFGNKRSDLTDVFPKFYEHFNTNQAEPEECVTSLLCGEAAEFGLRMTRENCQNGKSIEIKADLHPRQLLVQISLEKNIPEQLRIIKNTASRMQQQLVEWGLCLKKRRMSKDTYPYYLRVLDALFLDVAKNEIAKVLLPDNQNEYPDYLANKKISNWIIAAEDLCDKGYLSFFQ